MAFVGDISIVNGLINPFITGGAPPCREPGEIPGVSFFVLLGRSRKTVVSHLIPFGNDPE